MKLIHMEHRIFLLNYNKKSIFIIIIKYYSYIVLFKKNYSVLKKEIQPENANKMRMRSKYMSTEEVKK